MVPREIQSGFFPVNRRTAEAQPPEQAPATPADSASPRYANIGDTFRMNKNTQKLSFRKSDETEDYVTVEVVPKETDAPGVFMNIKGCLTEAR